MICLTKARKCIFPSKIFTNFRLVLCFFAAVLLLMILKSHFKRKPSHSQQQMYGLSTLPHVEPKQKCIHPNLDPHHPSLLKFFFNIPKLSCTRKEDNWLYVANGTIYFSDKVSKVRGALSCDIYPLVRTDDFQTLDGTKIPDVKNGTRMTSDFFKAKCRSAPGNDTYTNAHSGIFPKTTIREKANNTFTNSLPLNILMVGLDSISRMTAIRKLPKTRDYFLNHLKGFDLQGYNILGDGTPAAILPILTGMTEEELPEARRGHSGAKPVDGHPWIWNEYTKAGYVTAYAEDQPPIGTFHYRMLGFNKQPTDHYMRNFYIAADKMSSDYCYGSVPKHRYFLDWLRDVFVAYPNKRKFVFGFHCELSHADSNKLDYLDADVADFFKNMERSGYLNNTLLVFMSDHGARFSSTREAAQGKQEERMPMVSLRFPPWFETKFPDAHKSLMLNAKRLTTPYDIHATFQDILHFSGGGKANLSSRGISLFKEIPLERTCSSAGVEPHWCACLDWQTVDQSDATFNRILDTFVTHLNNLTHPHRDNCAKLRVKTIKAALKWSTNSKVLKYKKAADKDGRVGDFSDDTKDSEVFYQVTVSTFPGDGHFEFTVRHDLTADVINFTNKDMSRINKYGTDSDCVAKNYPHLRQYCYCRNLLKEKNEVLVKGSVNSG